MSHSAEESISLETHDERKVLRLLHVEKHRREPGHDYVAVLSVRSGDFSCERRFWFDSTYLDRAIKSLRRMDAANPGEAIIKQEYEPDFVMFKSDRSGHVTVSGEMSEHSELPQSLRFCFRTDQTVLGPLIRDLERLAGA